MKKSLLTIFAFLLLASAFAAPKRYKLLSSTTNWFNTANWSPVGLPGNGDTVSIPANVRLTLSSDLTLENIYFDLYGSLVLSGNNLKMTLQNTSTLNVHASGWIDGSKASQQIIMDNSIIYKGNQPIVLGSQIATSTSNGFLPYTENQILPVTFTAFNVARNTAGNAITWTTADEKNAAYYDVQRSTDGANWQHIATLYAAGTNTYTYSDKASVAGTVYYRIKQVDGNGLFTYTAMRMLRNNNVSLPIISAVQNKIMVLFTQPVSGKVLIQVIGLNGAVAAMQTVSAPSGTLQLPASGLRGIYVVHVSDGRELNTAQQIVL